VEIEKRLFGAATESAPQAPAVAVKALGGLESIPGRIQAALERKGQVIVYGPPGTGKTYWASLAARQLAARAAFGVRFEELNSAKQSEVTGSDSAQGLVRACTFHPAYGYEDFIEAIAPAQIPPGNYPSTCAKVFSSSSARMRKNNRARDFIL
jgi:5-methylcytosine-specific restriction protein B